MGKARKRGAPSPDARHGSPLKKTKPALSTVGSLGRDGAPTPGSEGARGVDGAGSNGKDGRSRRLVSAAGNDDEGKGTRADVTDTQALAPAPTMDLYHDPPELKMLRSRYSVVTMRIGAYAKLRHKVRALLERMQAARDDLPSRPTVIILQACGDGAGAARMISVVEIAKREFEKQKDRRDDSEETMEAEGLEESVGRQRTWYQYSRVDGRLQRWSGETGQEKRVQRLVQLAEADGRRAKAAVGNKVDGNGSIAAKEAGIPGAAAAAAQAGPGDDMEEGEMVQGGGPGKEIDGDAGARNGGDPATDNEDPHTVEDNGLIQMRAGVDDQDGGKDGDESDAFEDMVVAVPPPRRPSQHAACGDDNNSRVSSPGGRIRNIPIFSIFLSLVRIAALDDLLG